MVDHGGSQLDHGHLSEIAAKPVVVTKGQTRSQRIKGSPGVTICTSACRSMASR